MQLIIAGSYDQFRHNFKHNYMDYKYMARLPEDLRGQADTILLLSGTYYMRKDYADNEEEIYSYCRQHNISIVKRMSEDKR